MKFIDLFAGIGGMRLGVEKAIPNSECVMTSEIKPYAIEVYKSNFKGEVRGDITKIDSKDIPDFDLLLAGFPCQPFSDAGKRMGFMDTRGTLFFEIERILRDKKPKSFILENVQGLVTHDKGKTLTTILGKLKSLGYKTVWKVLDSQYFGVSQSRKRIFIVGNLYQEVNLDFEPVKPIPLKNVLLSGLYCPNSKLTELLLNKYTTKQLAGKVIRDKRGGPNNIHSWDIGIRGEVDDESKVLMNLILKNRRRKQWYESRGIEFTGGEIPLTLDNIQSFYPNSNLEVKLNNLCDLGYLKYVHPKIKGIIRYDLEAGYTLTAGKLSFEFSNILHPDKVSPTLVATDMHKLAVIDNGKLRKLSIREGLRLSGYPDNFTLNLPIKKAYNLIGNTVTPPVVESIANLLKVIICI